MDTNYKIIEDALRGDEEEIAFEEIPDESESPLIQPVVSKTEEKAQDRPQQEAANKATTGQGESQQQSQDVPENDAPEQEVNGSPDELQQEGNESEPGFTIPLSHAKLMADSILGVANNLLEVGGGYFVTVRKHKDFYEFDELIKVIEEQNGKNIKRLKLDDEDKAMLRPLLIVVLRKQTKVMTPEQQLVAVCLSILIKKAKMVVEIRQENQRLVERLLDIIQKERERYEASAGRNDDNSENKEEQKEQRRSDSDKVEFVEVEEVLAPNHSNQTGIPDEAIERFDH